MEWIGGRTGQIEFDGDNLVVAIGANTVTGNRENQWSIRCQLYN